ncbi:hypothetical protein [uncultured Thiodictyon sp.]|jgi:type I restriction enzyme S subunit|uniref:hypothetical protein n=1 Tax=uncultured Thiodictyon sp. TaxID=1846217 RepID=UPI0025CD86DA|nr:hypothetical protein [uncultured Thiodictyon sp.]
MVVPDKWKKIALRSVVADIQAGFAQSPKFGASVGQIRTHNVTPEGKISLDGIKSVSPSGKEIQRYSLLPGDIVFNNTNSEG